MAERKYFSTPEGGVPPHPLIVGSPRLSSHFSFARSTLASIFPVCAPHSFWLIYFYTLNVAALRWCLRFRCSSRCVRGEKGRRRCWRRPEGGGRQSLDGRIEKQQLGRLVWVALGPRPRWVPIMLNRKWSPAIECLLSCSLPEVHNGDAGRGAFILSLSRGISLPRCNVTQKLNSLVLMPGLRRHRAPPSLYPLLLRYITITTPFAVCA